MKLLACRKMIEKTIFNGITREVLIHFSKTLRHSGVAITKLRTFILIHLLMLISILIFLGIVL